MTLHGAGIKERDGAGTLHDAGIKEWERRTAHGAVMQGRCTAPKLKNGRDARRTAPGRDARRRNATGIKEWEKRTAHGAVMQGRCTAPELKNGRDARRTGCTAPELKNGRERRTARRWDATHGAGTLYVKSPLRVLF